MTRYRRLLPLAGLALVSAFLLAMAWEFLLEDLVVTRIGREASGASPPNKWADVIEVTCFAAIALGVLLVSSLSIGARPGRKEEETYEEDVDYRTIAQSAGDAIITMDEAGIVTSWNAVAEKMFGYGADEMYQKPVIELMPERYRDAHARGLARANAGGKGRALGTTLELWGLRENGDEFPLELSLSKWPGKRPRGYTAIIRDITERKRNEMAMREAAERLQKMVETAPDAIVVIDLSGTIVSWNPGAWKVFGYEEDEAIGAAATMLMPERYRKAHEDGLRRLRHHGASRLIGQTVRLHGLRKDGSEFPLQLSLGTWSAGDQQFFSAIIRDTSEDSENETPRGF